MILRNVGWLNGMDWGRDGFLYAPVWSKGQVVRIDVNSGKTEILTDGFGNPAAVKFDSRDRLHLVDYQTGKVWRISIQTGRKEVLIQLSPHLDNLAFDSKDRLFVSHADEGYIYEILSEKSTATQSTQRERLSFSEISVTSSKAHAPNKVQGEAGVRMHFSEYAKFDKNPNLW